MRLLGHVRADPSPGGQLISSSNVTLLSMNINGVQVEAVEWHEVGGLVRRSPVVIVLPLRTMSECELLARAAGEDVMRGIGLLVRSLASPILDGRDFRSRYDVDGGGLCARCLSP